MLGWNKMEGLTSHIRHIRHISLLIHTHEELYGGACLKCLKSLFAFSRLNMPKFGVFPLEMKVLKKALTFISNGTFGVKR